MDRFVVQRNKRTQEELLTASHFYFNTPLFTIDAQFSLITKHVQNNLSIKYNLNLLTFLNAQNLESMLK